MLGGIWGRRVNQDERFLNDYRRRGGYRCSVGRYKDL